MDIKTLTSPITGGREEGRNILAFDRNSFNIQTWKVEGYEIFAPTKLVNGKKRGGAHHCYPFFGSGKGELFGGFDTRHGIVRDGMHTRRQWSPHDALHKRAFRFPYPHRKLFDLQRSNHYDVCMTYGVTDEHRLDFEMTAVTPGPIVQYGFHPYFRLDKDKSPRWEIIYNLDKKITLRQAKDELKNGPVKLMIWSKDLMIKTNVGRFKVQLESGFGNDAMLVLWAEHHTRHICVEWVQFDWRDGVTLEQVPYGRIGEPDLLGNREVKIRWSITVEELF